MLTGSTGMQLKQLECHQLGAPLVTVICCSSLWMSTDRYGSDEMNPMPNNPIYVIIAWVIAVSMVLYALPTRTVTYQLVLGIVRLKLFTGMMTSS